jgi:hypothetical protein
MRVLKPTSDLNQIGNDFSVFLAGSIEMGIAEDWQTNLDNKLKTAANLCLLSPRRNDWDASWEQKMENPEFNAQVTWELDALEVADLIVFYFAPDTKSPISLLELGLFAQSKKVVVFCPAAFWRKGNVDIVCHRYGIEQVGSFEEMIEVILKVKSKK